MILSPSIHRLPNRPDSEAVLASIVPEASLPGLRPRTLDEQEFARRIQSTRTLDELFSEISSGTDEAEDFDVVAAINETRRESGFRMPDPSTNPEGIR